ncbi:hypothetical protein [Rhodopirellula sp. SWK7]|uniref:hypothetical protein n=1 Tax=Rhodopirellula sp. SWK7 TaxID=595460 RepID=UPI0002BF2D4B|nr:hypothetical protein [Rhodopirellula sp. SWK7]EMI43761.1 hypothetical protein RRSWK_03611 [Rhodopirellula sp. SWK7]
MRIFCLTAFFLTSCIGCGGDGQEVIADQDELAAYVAENPSPTDEELMGEMAGAEAEVEIE